MFLTRRSLPVCVSAVALMLAGCVTPPPPPPVKPPQPAPTVPAQPPAQPPQPTVPATPAPPAKAEFIPARFADLPGWNRDDLRAAWPAFMLSCSKMAGSADWKEPCAIAKTVDANSESAIRLYFESFFDPHQVIGPDGADNGLITGYYEPLLRGSRKRGGPYQTPLYKVPDDMVIIDLGSVYPELANKRVRGRLKGKRVVPYPARDEISKSGLPGNELLWVDDAVEAFFLEVQGSGRVQMADGETVRVAYADQNGRPYQSIGKWLVQKGELTIEQATAQGIKAWIDGHPTRQQELFNANPSYVFFKEEKLPDPKVGPKGTLNVPLTPQRSVAIDRNQLPLGAPVYLNTTLPGDDEMPLQRLMMAQDTGGAIKGAVRLDFFFGFGAEAADLAGRMKQRGNIWVLLPKLAR
ncbi:murein transglycosylase [Pseudoduganella eburnea]|uniref:peptidoglycan lytic exotransglycosylase n=1 Tax=Massilia eburnea TaxID=1776165 RepID=A0A6L6QQ04_9BURK|nr:murein transglycosylase A [Massilia eburnea]MTW13623.1 murein transglycosylase [Massilia eburnea]